MAEHSIQDEQISELAPTDCERVPTPEVECEASATGEAIPAKPPKRSPMKRVKELLWLGRLDRYIIRTFLGTYFFSILLIISVSVVFDINEKIDDFVKPEVPLSGIVLDYYMNFIPYYANLFSPLFVFISVIFFTSRLAENSEIIAMLASGMSFRRLLRPYLLSALVISGLTFVLNNYIIPPGTRSRINFENEYLRDKKTIFVSGVHLEVKPGTFLFIQSFDGNDKRGYQIALERYDGRDLVARLTAESAQYDSLGRWTLYAYRDRQFSKYRETVSVGDKLDTLIGIAPSDFLVTEKDVEMLTSPQLAYYIQKQSERGVGNAKLFAIELHKRLASVFSAFILTLIGAILSAQKVKNGLGINIAIGLGLSFGYILFMTITSTFAVSGSMPPWLAAWLPNFVFIAIALSLWRKAPQ